MQKWYLFVTRRGETERMLRLKPATGRPCIPAFLVAGTVPAFCLHFFCVFTQRRKGDLCVPASLETILAFEKMPLGRSRACSTPAFSRRLPWKRIRLRPIALRWLETQRVARKRSVIYKKSTCLCLRLPVAVSSSETQECWATSVAGFSYVVCMDKNWWNITLSPGVFTGRSWWK